MRIFIGSLFFLGLYSASAQSLVQLQQNPLLISASFTGSDSAARLCLAGQQYKMNYNFPARKEKNENQAYFLSFDRKTSSGKSAWGGYAHYWSYDVSRHLLPDSLRQYQPTEAKGQLSAETAEMGINYVPRFWKIQLLQKSLDLIPASFISYSYHRADLSGSESSIVPYDMLMAGKKEPTPAHQGEETHGKNATWHRIGVGGSIMLRNQKFFASYQVAFRFDQVDLNYHYHAIETELETKETIFENQEEGTYKGLTVNATNSFAVGAYFPKRSNSLIQFVPMAVFTYNVNNLGDAPANLPFSTYYYVSNPYYDYTSVYGNNTQNLSFNGRIWKIVMGVNLGVSSSWTSTGNYYIGYKAKKWVATLGLVPANNESFYNASLQMRIGK